MIFRFESGSFLKGVWDHVIKKYGADKSEKVVLSPTLPKYLKIIVSF
jgi:hypothetical protein